MEKEDLIEQLAPSPGGRNRKTYKVTKKGMRALEDWLKDDVALERARNELLLKVFFGKLSSPTVTITHIASYKQKITEKMLILAKFKTQLPREYPDDPGLPYWLLTIEFGLRRMQASLEWCDYALKKLKSLPNEESI